MAGIRATRARTKRTRTTVRRQSIAAVAAALTAVLVGCGIAPPSGGRVAIGRSTAVTRLDQNDGDPAGADHPLLDPAVAAADTAPMVALTFDDGPNPAATPQVLDILDRYGVSATFFAVGLQVAAHPDLAQAIVARGHALANHSWSHANFAKLKAPAVRDQIARTDDRIAAITGRRPTCVRPPYGATNAAINGIIGASGHHSVLWTVDPLDWKRPGAGAIAARVLGGVGPNSIVLMHDGGGNRAQTVAALPIIIEGLRARGFRFVSICRPIDLTAPAPAPAAPPTVAEPTATVAPTTTAAPPTSSTSTPSAT